MPKVPGVNHLDAVRASRPRGLYFRCAEAACGRPLTFAVSGLRASSFPRKPIPIRISV